MILKGLFPSPIGNILIQTNESELLSLSFMDKGVDEEQFRDTALIHLIKQQLQAYFEKKLQKFSIPISLQVTDFQNKVLLEVEKVNFGEIITYTQLAQRMGSSRLVRAVATANAANPLLLVIPCHRIIGKNGILTGYSGGIWRKDWLLKHESKIADLW